LRHRIAVQRSRLVGFSCLARRVSRSAFGNIRTPFLSEEATSSASAESVSFLAAARRTHRSLTPTA
jgi:hypothetical protein